MSEVSSLRDALELASFLVTAIGLPFAIGVFLYEQRRERENEEEEAYQLLSNAYNDFHNAMPLMLRGEDPAFQGYIRRLAQEERAGSIIAP